ncbi:hypothetical protein hamaS1_29030 [Moorella sp. Hama-1]|nr:hypothetical protein hamaS1_29030 [Moorella sp. Hama-1]
MSFCFLARSTPSQIWTVARGISIISLQTCLIKKFATGSCFSCRLPPEAIAVKDFFPQCRNKGVAGRGVAGSA